MLKKIMGVSLATFIAITSIQAQEVKIEKHSKEMSPAIKKSDIKEVSVKQAPVASTTQVKSPRIEAESDILKVGYGQPSKNGRVIFGDLVPYGQIWRTGANMSTDVTFKSDVTFAGKEIKAGTYSLFTIPNEKEWTVILNSKSGQKGAAEYEQYKSQNVAEVTVPVTQSSTVVEKFTIEPVANALEMSWDQTKVSIPVQKK